MRANLPMLNSALTSYSPAQQYFLYDRLAKDSSAADLGGVVTDLLVDHHLDRGNITEVMRICKRESKANGRSNPELWSKVLAHMVARCELVTEQQATEALRRGSSHRSRKRISERRHSGETASP